MTIKTSFDLIDIYLISPIIILFVTSLVPVMTKAFNKNEEPSSTISLFVPIIGGVMAAAASIGSGAYLMMEGISSKYLFSGALVMDGVSVWISVVISLIACFALMLSRENYYTRTSLFSEYVFLLLNAVVGMFVVVWSNDLIVTFIGVEMMSLCVYILVAINREFKLSKEAAIKYFVLGSFGSALLIFGIAYIFGGAGTTYLNEISQNSLRLMGESTYFLIGVLFVIFGFAFKVSLFPFYNWTPDVYQGSATPMVAFMATGVKIASFVALLRFITTNVLYEQEVVLNILQWLAVLTMIAGNIGAIVQTNLKRILAYSSVAHSGYILIGLIAIGTQGGASLGASSVLFYLLSYAIMTFGAFACVNLFEVKTETKLTVTDLKGLAYRHPYIALAFSLFMISLAGLPPTIGFFGKFYIFSAAISQGLNWLAVWGVLSSVVSVYYYLRPLVMMYMYDEGGAEIFGRPASTQFTIGLTAFMVIIIGLASNPFYSQIAKSVQALF